MDMTGVAKEVFEVLLGYNYNVKLYGEKGEDNVTEPAEARRMFAQSPNLMVAIKDLGDDSCVELTYGKSTHANDIEGLMQALRTVVTKYNMTFVPHQHGQEIDPKNFQNLEAVSESKERIMHLCEGMFGTSNKSYLMLEHAKLIVHHADRLNLRRPGARASKIAEVFVEAQGQRVRLPTTDLAAARRLTESVNAGKSISIAIIEMEQLNRPRKPKFNPHALAENNSVVRDYLRWMDRFSPQRALVETGFLDGPSLTAEPNGFEADGVNDFDAQEFLMSDEMKDVLPSEIDDEGKDVSKRDVMTALKTFLRHRHQHDDFGPIDAEPASEENSESEELADSVWDEVEDALREAGYVIHDDMTEDDDVNEVPDYEIDGQQMLADCTITREDVLLPNRDQGDGLAREVGKATVHADPLHPDEESDPDMSYVERLQTLSGMRSGKPY